uniref:DNA polymerase epsilon subunit 4 n=1 Tax=Podarcis muralis TaxID=64176 RepID=A0A670K7Q5_PODMU
MALAEGNAVAASAPADEESEPPPPPPAAPGAAAAAATSSGAARPARLPLARVKALVKADPDVSLASQEAIFILARAAELFVETIAKDAYIYAQQGKRKTLQRKDLDNAIEAIDEFAFLEGKVWFQVFLVVLLPCQNGELALPCVPVRFTGDRSPSRGRQDQGQDGGEGAGTGVEEPRV